ncbi:MAG TPA: ABC transporter substrate-binding protein [Beijerinckiaceae bacterium]|nr:ABC transporter substrate-binding protein [Beijerinckiaceae bacterium]
MQRILRSFVLGAALVLSLPAQAQEKLKVGVVLSLSGPPAALGKQALDGFQLGLKALGGKFAGREVETVVVDDELKPDLAITKVQALIDRDKVDFVVGPIFSNVLQAIIKPVTDQKIFLISPNAGPSSFAGKACNPYFFVTSYENDRIHAASGTFAQEKGYKRVFLLAPNYQAGKDAIEGFKLTFKGEIVDEVYTPLTQLDFSAELAKIAAAKPDAIYTFMPGGLGVNLVKQYRQAGLSDIPFISAFTVDESTLPAQQDSAVGFYGSSNWAPNLDTPQNKAFVADFEKAYNYVPGSYAFEAYDAALLIDSALKATGGKTDDKEALRAALKKADFQSLRGSFKFNNNGYPIQNFYITKVAKRPDGKYQTEIVQTVFKDDVDPHGKECPLK